MWAFLTLLWRENMTTSQLDISPVPSGVSINAKQRLFVINHGDGVTCMGFDHCFETATQIARALRVQGPRPSAAPSTATSSTCHSWASTAKARFPK